MPPESEQYSVVKTSQRVFSTKYLDMLLIFFRWTVAMADFIFTWISDLNSFLLILMNGKSALADVLGI